MEKDALNRLADAAKSINISLDERELNLFSRYHDELIIWNESMNLTAMKSSMDIIIKHFIDSLTVAPFLHSSHIRLLDVGTGAGFPGIPLKIVLSPMSIHLLESSRKKISFLKQVIRLLSLENIEILHGRAEHLSKETIHQNTFDVVVSRATYRLSSWMKIGSPFLKFQGLLIAMKGPKVKEEMEEAVATSERVGLCLVGHHKLHLPLTGDIRNILIYKQVRE